MKRLILAILISFALCAPVISAQEPENIVLEDGGLVITLYNRGGVCGVISFARADGTETPWFSNAFDVVYGEKVEPEALRVFYEDAWVENGVLTAVTTEGDRILYDIAAKKVSGAKSYNNENKVLEARKYAERRELFEEGYAGILPVAAAALFSLAICAAALFLFIRARKARTAG